MGLLLKRKLLQLSRELLDETRIIQQRVIPLLVGLLGFSGSSCFFRNFPETYSFDALFRVGYLWMTLILKRVLLQLGRQLHDETCIIPQRANASIKFYVSYLWVELIVSVISKKLIVWMRFFVSDICGWGSYLRGYYCSQVDSYTTNPRLLLRGIRFVFADMSLISVSS